MIPALHASCLILSRYNINIPLFFSLCLGSIFVFKGGYAEGTCAALTQKSAEVTVIMRWAWVAFIVLISLLLKVMQCVIQSRTEAAK